MSTKQTNTQKRLNGKTPSADSAEELESFTSGNGVNGGNGNYPNNETPAEKEKRLSLAKLLALHPDVQATLATDPDQFSPITSKSRMKSFRYALAGWLYMLKYQKNTRLQIVATLAVFVLGMWLGLRPIEWAALVIIITFNWLTEFMNAAIEAVVNLASPGIHPMARVAKDVAAAAVLLSAIAAVIVGGLIMLPPLLERIFFHI